MAKIFVTLFMALLATAASARTLKQLDYAEAVPSNLTDFVRRSMILIGDDNTDYVDYSVHGSWKHATATGRMLVQNAQGGWSRCTVILVYTNIVLTNAHCFTVDKSAAVMAFDQNRLNTNIIQFLVQDGQGQYEARITHLWPNPSASKWFNKVRSLTIDQHDWVIGRLDKAVGSNLVVGAKVGYVKVLRKTSADIQIVINQNAWNAAAAKTTASLSLIGFSGFTAYPCRDTACWQRTYRATNNCVFKSVDRTYNVLYHNCDSEGGASGAGVVYCAPSQTTCYVYGLHKGGSESKQLNIAVPTSQFYDVLQSVIAGWGFEEGLTLSGGTGTPIGTTVRTLIDGADD
jgi:V8-like Glu-specific endopeptidase